MEVGVGAAPAEAATREESRAENYRNHPGQNALLSCLLSLADFTAPTRNGFSHGTYIRWQLRNRCAHEEQSVLFDLITAYD